MQGLWIPGFMLSHVKRTSECITEPAFKYTTENDTVLLLSVTLTKIHQNILAMPIMPSSIQIIAQSPKSSLSSTANDKKHNTHLSYFWKFFSQSKFSRGGPRILSGWPGPPAPLLAKPLPSVDLFPRSIDEW